MAAAVEWARGRQWVMTVTVGSHDLDATGGDDKGVREVACHVLPAVFLKYYLRFSAPLSPGSRRGGARLNALVFKKCTIFDSEKLISAARFQGWSRACQGVERSINVRHQQVGRDP